MNRDVERRTRMRPSPHSRQRRVAFTQHYRPQGQLRGPNSPFLLPALAATEPVQCLL